MVFSSVVFLFYFLPVVLLVYFLTPDKYRNLVIFSSSVFFYAWGEPIYIVLILFSTILDFTCGIKIKENGGSSAKKWLLISVFMNLGLLSFFKYADFIILNLNAVTGTSINLLNVPLPIGISFYTFQTMSYTLDVFRGEVEPQKNIISFGSYVALFPQLIAGPIVRYKTVARELNNRESSLSDISIGMTRFIIGLSKKVLIANNIGLVWENILKIEISNLPMATAWLGVLAFSFQIYYDFSAYSDMAIGLGRIFGFNFLENFNYPYMSKSITEFWRRWHISLGTWFREYVYIPLGGNKKGLATQLRNIIIVWFLTGIWHGASWNFVLWGLYFGGILIIEKAFLLDFLEKIPTILRRVYTLLIVLISWVIFSFDSMSTVIQYLSVMFGRNYLLYDSRTIYILYTNFMFFIIAIIGSTSFPKRVWMKKRTSMKEYWIYENAFIVLLFLISTAYLVDQSYNPFLYFRF